MDLPNVFITALYGTACIVSTVTVFNIFWGNHKWHSEINEFEKAMKKKNFSVESVALFKPSMQREAVILSGSVLAKENFIGKKILEKGSDFETYEFLLDKDVYVEHLKKGSIWGFVETKPFLLKEFSKGE